MAEDIDQLGISATGVREAGDGTGVDPVVPLASTDGGGEPTLTADPVFERLQLDDTSWIDVSRGWIQNADTLHDLLTDATRWEQGRVWRYEKWVDEPRLSGYWLAGRRPAHPVILDAHRSLRRRYGVTFDGAALARYRNGRDSVAFHRDREMRWLEDTVIVVLSLGQRRPFLLRPRASRYRHQAPGNAATHDLAPSSGDLLVMGGRAQTDWEHAVPKLDGRVGSRISLQWRWTSKRGQPEQGANYRAPRNFSR